MLKILSGDFSEKGCLVSSLGTFSIIESNGFLSKKTETILNNNIERVELMTEEKAKSFLGAAGLGIAGAIVLGLLGAVAGLLAGGNKKEICFACYLKDGKKFMAVADAKTYQKLAALAF